MKSNSAPVEDVNLFAAPSVAEVQREWERVRPLGLRFFLWSGLMAGLLVGLVSGLICFYEGPSSGFLPPALRTAAAAALAGRPPLVDLLLQTRAGWFSAIMGFLFLQHAVRCRRSAAQIVLPLSGLVLSGFVVTILLNVLGEGTPWLRQDRLMSGAVLKFFPVSVVLTSAFLYGCGFRRVLSQAFYVSLAASLIVLLLGWLVEVVGDSFFGMRQLLYSDPARWMLVNSVSCGIRAFLIFFAVVMVMGLSYRHLGPSQIAAETIRRAAGERGWMAED